MLNKKIISTYENSVAISDTNKILFYTNESANMYDYDYDDEDTNYYKNSQNIIIKNVKNDNICVTKYSVIFSYNNYIYIMDTKQNISELFRIPNNYIVKKIVYKNSDVYILCHGSFGSVIYYRNFKEEKDFEKLNIQYDDIKDIIIDDSDNNNEIILQRYNSILIKNTKNSDIEDFYKVHKNETFVEIAGIYCKKIFINKDIYIIDENNHCYIYRHSKDFVRYPNYTYNNKTYLNIGKVHDICQKGMKIYALDLDGNIVCYFGYQKLNILGNIKFKALYRTNESLFLISTNNEVYVLEKNIFNTLTYSKIGEYTKIIF